MKAKRVLRGGSWSNYPRWAAYRNGDIDVYRVYIIGFRLTRVRKKK